MDVFLMIRRNKTTIFTDCKDTAKVYEVKKIIQGILKRSPDEMKLGDITNNRVYEDDQTLSDCGLSGSVGRAHTPLPIALAFKDPVSQEFEPFKVEDYSTPPELPEVMKNDTHSGD